MMLARDSGRSKSLTGREAGSICMAHMIEPLQPKVNLWTQHRLTGVKCRTRQRR
jgi:hypothetical protein